MAISHIAAPFFLIMEYLPEGNLQSYLRDRKADMLEMDMAVEGATVACPIQLLTFASQVACGMDYLSSLGVGLSIEVTS